MNNFAFFNGRKFGARKLKIECILRIGISNILAQERTFYDFSFLSYHGYLNPDTQTEENTDRRKKNILA